MDFNNKKFSLSKISGVVTIILSTLFLVGTLVDLIEVLSMTELEDPGYVILTHVVWFCLNLTFLGFGIGARSKPVLRLKKAIMGERKKFIWFYGKTKNKLTMSALSIAIFILCFDMSVNFKANGSITGEIFSIVQLVVCPLYIIVAFLQTWTIFIKDKRVYDSEYKLITKETSAREFYLGLANSNKMYNRAKFLFSKICGTLVMANGVLILIESIYVVIDSIRYGIALGVSDWKVFVLDLVVAIAKLVFGGILISCSLSLGDKPTQKIISTDYYEKGMDREFRWKYGSAAKKVCIIVLSSAITFVSFWANTEIMAIIHPVIMQFVLISSAVMVLYYLSTIAFALSATACLLSLVIQDKKVHKLEYNIYNLLAGI